MTTAYDDLSDAVFAADGVYAPQHDSHLLLDVLEQVRSRSRATRRRPVYGQRRSGNRRRRARCVGRSPLLTSASVQFAARERTRWPQASRSMSTWGRGRAHSNSGRSMSWSATRPTCPSDVEGTSAQTGPAWAWDAGTDGRLLLDPLCETASAPSRRRRHHAPCAIRVLRTRQIAGALRLRRSEGRNDCLPIDSVRPGAHRPGATGWKTPAGRPGRRRRNWS